MVYFMEKRDKYRKRTYNGNGEQKDKPGRRTNRVRTPSMDEIRAKINKLLEDESRVGDVLLIALSNIYLADAVHQLKHSLVKMANEA